MIDELRDELDAVLNLVRKRLEVAGRLPERKQRALLRHVRAFMAAAFSGEPPRPADQHRWLTIVTMLDEAEKLPAAPPPPPNRLRRGTHLRTVE